jgi:hypothetical protein
VSEPVQRRPFALGPFLLGLALVAALPLAGRALRGPQAPRCATDGVPLTQGAPVVRMAFEKPPEREFCCVRCAEAWLAATGTKALRVRVTDSVSGAGIEGERAWFVRSTVVAQPATGDRVHAFVDEQDARRHVEVYRGLLLDGPARPLGLQPLR